VRCARGAGLVRGFAVIGLFACARLLAPSLRTCNAHYVASLMVKDLVVEARRGSVKLVGGGLVTGGGAGRYGILSCRSINLSRSSWSNLTGDKSFRARYDHLTSSFGNLLFCRGQKSKEILTYSREILSLFERIFVAFHRALNNPTRPSQQGSEAYLPQISSRICSIMSRRVGWTPRAAVSLD